VPENGEDNAERTAKGNGCIDDETESFFGDWVDRISSQIRPIVPLIPSSLQPDPDPDSDSDFVAIVCAGESVWSNFSRSSTF
jgi:hypothetical protein